VTDAIITLTTDFGEESPYVPAMKGVLLSINPAARMVDLSHLVPPQDIAYVAFFLAEAIPFFPRHALHVVVVDPGVGTNRALLYAEAAEHRLLLPDNGAITLLAARHPVKRVRRLAEPRYWRPSVSATFHGRDILAPVAAHLSLGVHPDSLGPAVDEWVRLEMPIAVKEARGWRGEVLFIDHFGNLLTNLPADQLPDRPFRLRIGEKEHQVRRVRAYGDGKIGELVALVSSGGWWELAIVNGSAAREIGARRGDGVQVMLAG
jgi:S-adenosylmethionine hydrolase